MIKPFFCLLILFFHCVFQVSAQDDEQGFSVQPRILKATEHGIGRMMPDLTVKDLQGREMRLSESKNGKALVIIIFSAFCPISNKFGPELARLEKDYAGKQVAFIFDCPIDAETSQDLASYASKYQLKSRIVHDADGKLAKMLGAATTTEAFVLDAARTLIYRGAINDQYGLGYSKDKPTKTYLRDAIDAMLCGKTPAVAATTAPGCALDLADGRSTVEKIPLTYYNQITRIMQANCVECHHACGVAPFSLETFTDMI